VCVVIVVAGCWTSREDRASLVYFSGSITVEIFESRLTIWSFPNRTDVKRRGWHYRHDSRDSKILNRYGFNLPRIIHKRRWNHWLWGSLWSWYIRVPFWLMLLPFALPTTILWLRDRRPGKGHCPHCGYNLTGNESGICPECATPVTKQETTA